MEGNDDKAMEIIKEHDQSLYDFVRAKVDLIPNFLDNEDVIRRWNNVGASMWKSLVRELENIASYDVVTQQLDDAEGNFDDISDTILREYLETFPTLIWVRLLLPDSESAFRLLIKIDRLDYLTAAMDIVEKRKIGSRDSVEELLADSVKWVHVIGYLKSIEQADYLHDNITHRACIKPMMMMKVYKIFNSSSRMDGFYYYHVLEAGVMDYDALFDSLVESDENMCLAPESAIVYYFSSYRHLIYAEKEMRLGKFFNKMFRMDYVELVRLVANKTMSKNLVNYSYIQSLEMLKVLDGLQLVDWHRFFSYVHWSPMLLKSDEFVPWIVANGKITTREEFMQLLFALLGDGIVNFSAIKLLVTHPVHRTYLPLDLDGDSIYNPIVSCDGQTAKDTITLIDFFVSRGASLSRLMVLSDAYVRYESVDARAIIRALLKANVYISYHYSDIERVEIIRDCAYDNNVAVLEELYTRKITTIEDIWGAMTLIKIKDGVNTDPYDVLLTLANAYRYDNL